MNIYRFGLLSSMGIIALTNSAFVPFFISYGSDGTNASEESLGLCLMIVTILGSVFSFFYLKKTNTSKVKHVYLTSMLLISLSLLLISVAFSNKLGVIIVFISMLLYRIGSSIYVPNSRATLIDYQFDNLSTRTIFTHVKIFNSVGASIGPLLGALILSYYSFDGLVLCLFIISVLAFFVSSLSIKNIQKKSEIESVTEYLNKPFNIDKTLAFSIVTYFVIMGLAYSYIPLVIKSSSPESKMLVGVFFTVNSISIILLGIPVSKLANRLRKSSQMIIGLSFSALGLILLNTSLINHILIVSFVAVLFTIGEIICPIILQEELLKGEGDTVKKMSLYSFLGSGIGIGVGQYVGVTLAGISSIYSITTIVMICVFGYLMFNVSIRNQNEVECGA